MDTLLTNPAMRLFGITYLILVLKMIAVGGYTSSLRIRRHVYATPEDYKLLGLAPRSNGDEEIERARRAHQNDLENILPYFGVGFLYALTGPSQAAAGVFFIGYAAARVLHSVFYLLELQPHRTVAYTVALILMVAMLAKAFIALI